MQKHCVVLTVRFMVSDTFKNKKRLNIYKSLCHLVMVTFDD